MMMFYPISIVDQQDVSIPGFTICPSSKRIAYNESMLKMHGFESAGHYNYPRGWKTMEPFSWNSNGSISPGDM